MSKAITIKFYTDPGHGWGCVKIGLLKEFGILPEQISHYSFVKGKSVYLEEDCDATKLIAAIKAKGYTINFVEKHTDSRSPIRSYDAASPAYLARHA